MRFLRSIISLAMIAGCFGSGMATEQTKDEIITLPPCIQEYIWIEFTVTKDAPYSDNRRYRLKEVRKDGAVGLIDCGVEGAPAKIILVRPMPTKLKNGDRPPFIVVVAADPQKQSATIRELRQK
jgi:hypothetical protein